MRVEMVPSDTVKVAVIFEATGRMKPVWFEANGHRTQIEKVAYTWQHQEGNAIVLNFAVWDGERAYELAYNVKKGSWMVKVKSIDGQVMRS
jgi:hypothetical protein